MVLDPIPQPLPVHFFGSRSQPPTSPHNRSHSIIQTEVDSSIEYRWQDEIRWATCWSQPSCAQFCMILWLTLIYSSVDVSVVLGLCSSVWYWGHPLLQHRQQSYTLLLCNQSRFGESLSQSVTLFIAKASPPNPPEHKTSHSRVSRSTNWDLIKTSNLNLDREITRIWVCCCGGFGGCANESAVFFFFALWCVGVCCGYPSVGVIVCVVDTQVLVCLCVLWLPKCWCVGVCCGYPSGVVFVCVVVTQVHSSGASKVYVYIHVCTYICIHTHI